MTSKTIHEEMADTEEETVKCGLCAKEFASAKALQNHCRMEHMISHTIAELSVKTSPKTSYVKNKPKPVIDKEMVRMRTEEVLSSLEPTNILDLASKDISYIILKADETPPPKKKEPKYYKPNRNESREEKKVEVIKGPFECLQPTRIRKSTSSDGLCHQIFFSCCAYSVHHRDEHMRRRRAFRCQVCEKPLVSIVEQTPFSCETCGEGFYYESELSSHKASGHVKIRPFECDICNKRFTQQGALVQHKRTHTGDRPYSCTYCSKSFAQKSGLAQHLRIHTKEKPFQCIICHKAFSQAVNLKLHMRNHTNLAPFQCGICGKRYKQSSNLNYHLKNHSLEELNKNRDTDVVETVPEEYVEIEIDPNVSFMPSDEVLCEETV